MTEADRNRDADRVAGMVLPTGDADLLLPASAVAEIVGYRPVAAVEDAPDWLLGSLDWRERLVPTVSIAAAQPQPGRRSCLVVCCTPSGNPDLPYVALLASAAPRLVRFDAADLKAADGPTDNPFVLDALTYEGRQACIPDLDAIERALLEVTPAASSE